MGLPISPPKILTNLNSMKISTPLVKTLSGLPALMSRLRLFGVVTALLMVFLLLKPTDTNACVYNSLLGKYNRAVARYNANPSAQNSFQVCRYYRRITKKFKNRPAPMLPPGVPCPPAPAPIGPGPMGGPAGGGGRGGVGGGQGFPGGPNIPFKVWVQNQLSTSCNVSWQIIADVSNPPGFSLTQSTGTITATAFGNVPTSLDSFMVTIAPTVSPGDSAMFHIYFIDGCTGFQYTEEFSSFKVKALDSITVEPRDVIQVAAGSSPFSNAWTFQNHSTTQKVVNFDFTFMGDPGSLEALNNLPTTFYIKNAGMVNKGQASASVTLDPGEIEDWEMQKVPTQFCDPEMIECCGISIDGAESCVWNPNDLTTHSCDGILELNGTGTGGLISVLVDTFLFQITTPPAMAAVDIVDEIAMQVQSAFEFLPDFYSQPVVDSNAFMIMTAPGTLIEIIVNDPGLTLDTAACDTVLVVGIDGKLEESLRIYPNPTNGERLNYAWKQSEVLEICLMDYSGKRLRIWKEMPESGTLDLKGEGIASGFYLLRLRTPSNRVKWAKVVIGD